MSPKETQSLPSENTIAGLFNSPFQFAIPSYQRAYSWKEKQLNQFVQDLDEQPENKPYFLGHFLFERDTTQAKKMFLIDGQQRLTTVIIFFSCLVRELERRSNSASCTDLRQRYLQRNDGNRLRTVEMNNAFFGTLIIEGVDPGLHAERPRSQRRINETHSYFTKTLQEQSEPQTLERWKQCIESAVITTFEVPSKVQATQIFAFQNDRGIDPTNLEKLKALLMHKVYTFSTSGCEEDEIADINHHFAKIYELNERTDLGEDTVLNHHCTAFLPAWDTALVVTQKAIKDQAEDKKVCWIKNFCRSLHDSFQFVLEIETAARRDPLFADPLILDAENSWPLMLKLYHDRTNIGNEHLHRMLRLMEIILFKKAYSNGGFRTNKFPEAAKAYQGDAEAILRQLEFWAKQGFIYYWAFNAEFRAYLNGNHHFCNETRYLLWKYENELRKEHKNGPITPEDYRNSQGDAKWCSTTEHVMPQNPEAGPLTQEFREHHLNNLGNLVLMNLSKNASANNAMPIEKLSHFYDSPLSSHKRIADTIRQNGEWGKSEIEARKQEIILFALKYWEAGESTTNNSAASSPSDTFE